MTDADRQALIAELVFDEGIRLKPYSDTEGCLTIGVGRNLTDDGISRQEAMALLDHDIDATLQTLTKEFSWFTALDPMRQRVLTNMCFNLGLGGLLKFPLMLEAVQIGNYHDAATDMLNSAWAKEVGDRAVRLSRMMETGQPT